MPRIKKPKFILLDNLAEEMQKNYVTTEGSHAGFSIGDKVEYIGNHYTGTVIGFTRGGLVLVQLDEHINFTCHCWGYRGFCVHPNNWRRICQG